MRYLPIALAIAAIAAVPAYGALIELKLRPKLDAPVEMPTCQMLMADSRLCWNAHPDVLRFPPNIYGEPDLCISREFMKELPRGLTKKEHRMYDGIFKFTRDHQRVWDRMQDLRVEMEALPPTRGSFDLLGRPKVHAVFKKWEKLFGFKTFMAVTAIDDREFYRHVANGELVTEFPLALGEVRTQINRPNPRPDVAADYHPVYAEVDHWLHLEFSHELQWHLIMREFELHPEAFGENLQRSDILWAYTNLASEHIAGVFPTIREIPRTIPLDWSNTGITEKYRQLLLLELLDTHENNPSSAGYFFEYANYWPWLFTRPGGKR